MALSTIQNNSLADTAVHGYRNLLTNSAMQVAQRGSSASIPANTVTYAADRWFAYYSSTDELAGTIAQDADAPDGFALSTKITTTTAETTIAADEYASFTQRMEGLDLQGLGFGTSAAQNLTLSFWVKSSITGTFAINMYQPDGSYVIGSTYTINSANTWEYKTITLDGNTLGSIVNDSTEGLRVTFTLAAGSDWTSTDNTSWGSYANGKWSYGQTQNGLITTLNATWQITGVQLEVGSEATPFEHRSYGDELARCQRYYYQVDNGTQNGKFYAAQYTASYKMFHFPFPTTMRATPTSTLPISSGALTEWNPTKDSVLAYITSNTSDTGTYHVPSSGNSAKFDAEL